MDDQKRLCVVFYRTAMDREPVRDWLKSLDPQERRIIGEDIKTVEFGWPVGMPVCRPIKGQSGLWEVGSSLSSGCIRAFYKKI